MVFDGTIALRDSISSVSVSSLDWSHSHLGYTADCHIHVWSNNLLISVI